MKTAYNEQQLIENDNGWMFYDAAFKCWKGIYNNLSGDSVLDIGCGGGVSIALIKVFNPFLHIEGFEGADSGKELWNIRNIKVTDGDIYNLPYTPSSFDTVYTSHVLEHCKEPEIIISESIRVSKKRIIHLVPDGNVDGKNFGSPHIHVFNRQNFIKLFKRANLKIVLYQSIQDFHMNSLMVVCDVTK